jgi:protoporphyrin/coproporphyrin ferrochelatase
MTIKPTGVMLMAYGGPDSLDDVEPYLLDVRGGRPTAPELLAEVRHRYALIGGRSPLLERTQAQADGLQQALGAEYRVYVGMRHWHPYIKEAMTEVAADQIERLVALVMAPHYSRMSVGAYMQRLREAREALLPGLQVTEIARWKTHPLFLDALAEKANSALARFGSDDVEIIFSAHSLPERILAGGDPYPQELLDTVHALVARLKGPVRWRFAYQSAGSTAEKWLGPEVGQVIAQLAAQGKRSILVQPVGFVCDHVEILHDIDIVYMQQAQGLGVHLERAESLNDSPLLIAALADLVRSAS